MVFKRDGIWARGVLLMGCAMGVLSLSEARPYFDQRSDLLIAQFDSKPDEDDIHTQAALGCMLAHPSFAGINYYAVAGAYGVQKDSFTFIDSTDLFNLAFGPENEKWTNAHKDRAASVVRIKTVAKAVLEAGGTVWVQEAGQSDVTADWVAALIADGISADLIKDQVIVVQHSHWNQNNTDKPDLAYVKAKTTYVKLDDGNKDPGTGAYWTPNFTTKVPAYLDAAKRSSNTVAKALWIEADRVCDEVVASWENPRIAAGGLDYSDTVEDWWIFHDETDVRDVASFWTKYVSDEQIKEVVPAKVDAPKAKRVVHDKAYNEKGGLVVVEVENTASELGLWIEKTDELKNGHTGASYLEFTGNTPKSGPATSPMEYAFKINQSGLYTIHLRCARETIGTRKDLANDCYIRVEGLYGEGPKAGTQHKSQAVLSVLMSDTKFFGGDDHSFVWASGNRLDPGGHNNKRVAIYDFREGETYTLVVSGRSQKFKLDRLVFRHESVAVEAAQNSALPESDLVTLQER